MAILLSGNNVRNIIADIANRISGFSSFILSYVHDEKSDTYFEDRFALSCENTINAANSIFVELIPRNWDDQSSN